jgi:hypothetical protein
MLLKFGANIVNGFVFYTSFTPDKVQNPVWGKKLIIKYHQTPLLLYLTGIFDGNTQNYLYPQTIPILMPAPF